MSVPGPTEVAPRPRRHPRPMILGLAAVGAAAWVLALVLHSRTTDKLPIPDPNGYEDLLRAARSIGGTPPKYGPRFGQIVRHSAGAAAVKLDPMASTWDEARAYLEANRDALVLARIGLGRECVVPVVFERGYAWSVIPNRGALRDLARVFLWEARLAIREDRSADAARSYLDMVRLGHASARGGLETDFWGPGLDVETGGLLGLDLIRDDLDPATCRRAIAVLGELDRRREPYRAFQGRSEACTVADSGQFQAVLWEIANYRAIPQQRAWLTESYDEAIAGLRLVEVELALRAYRAEKGEEPDGLKALVPSVLPALPLDPFTGRPPVYRRDKGGHVLYSVGPDRVDDGGAPLDRPNPRGRPTGDILPRSRGSSLTP